MTDIAKKFLIEILKLTNEEYSQMTCDEFEFEYSPELYQFLKEYYKWMEPTENIEPEVSNGTLTVSMSGAITYFIYLLT